jgi:hypothetical protein
VLAEVELVHAEVEPVLAALPVGATPSTPVEQRARPKKERNGKNRARLGAATVLP